ncbi:retropepsin-like aspartic protease [Stenotrophomonas sp. RS-48]|uniref:retropepsin-like aspartic protease n=1 Tax=Stenotrophomonas sp. RS-48 TaxID=3043300 RepID=UPI001313861C|nr:retropepsin-like aspartic protease [Stenotrophomonas sp. RS-48]MDI9248486.1 retropepsin-like aspartic protease [Stenotrophomonas sp. RS-48]
MRPLLLALLLVSSCAGAAETTRVTQIFNDPTPVSQALAQGDVAALRQLQVNATNTVVKKMARAAERRVLLDVPGAREASDECIQMAQQTTHLAGLTVCGALRAGVEVVAGDLPAWARLSMQARERVRAAAEKRGKTLGNVDVFTRIPDYAAMAGRPAPKVDSSGQGRIALNTGTVTVASSQDHDGGRVAYPNMAQLQIDGKTLEVLVDTGSALTIVHPAAITAPPLMEGFTLSGVLGDSQQRSRIAQPQTLQFGPLIISQPLVSVSERIPANLLGLDVLSRLGRVLIGKDGLQVLAEGSAAPACDAPMFSAADLSGTQTVPRLFITVDGKRQEAMLDTGNSGELMEALPIGVALPAGPVQHSVVQGVQGQQRRASVAREAIVQTLDGSAELQMSTSTGNHPSKTRYVLGGGSLRKVSIYLDFITNKACLMSLGATQSAH